MTREQQILSEYEVEPCSNCGEMGYTVPPELKLGITVKCLKCGCGWIAQNERQAKDKSVFDCISNFEPQPESSTVEERKEKE